MMFKWLKNIFDFDPRHGERLLRDLIKRYLEQSRYEVLDNLYCRKVDFIGKKSTEWTYYKEYWKLQGRLDAIDELIKIMNSH